MGPKIGSAGIMLADVPASSSKTFLLSILAASRDPAVPAPTEKEDSGYNRRDKNSSLSQLTDYVIELQFRVHQRLHVLRHPFEYVYIEYV